jgi:LysR family glycine cleavage system transcriptional activator
MQAAMDDAGVVLGWRNLAATDLAAGRLSMPFDLELPMQLGFHLVSSFVSASRPKVIAFRKWLLAEIERS